MVLEEGAGAAQALVAGRREGPRVAHVLFLVGQDEQDIVAAVARARRIGGRETRFAAAGDGRRLGDRGIGRDGGAGQRGAGLKERPARRCWFAHQERSLATLGMTEGVPSAPPVIPRAEPEGPLGQQRRYPQATE